MSQKNLRVHIASVGLDVPERIWNPLVRMRADKIYLITHLADSAEVESIIKVVRKKLRKELQSSELTLIRTNIWDLFLCLKEYREVFLLERENSIFVNVSTGSKIASISGMLACMIWKGNAYYAQLDYSGASNPRSAKLSIRLIEELPVYSIRTPSRESLKILGIIEKSGGQIKKKDLIRELQSSEHAIIEQYRSDQRTAPHSRLRALLDPLEREWGLVEVEASGRRSIVRMTIQGKTALTIFGTPAK